MRKSHPSRPSILAAIGNTPLVRLPHDQLNLYGKLEFLNPSGSIKDRSAIYMIEQAEHKGLLKPGYTLIEASSGNQGIAVAMIGAIKGYPVIITVPDRTSKEKIATLKAYGAKVIVCADEDHGYTEVAKKMHHQMPYSYMLNQYFNPENAEAHFLSTGPEIWQQTEGKITHIILALGSCGTAMGVSRYLKGQNPNVKVIGVDAATSALSSQVPSPYQAEGIGVDMLDGLFDKRLVDAVYPVADEAIFAKTKLLAKQQGLLVGLSSAAVMLGVEQFAKNHIPHQDDRVVAILADSGRAYLHKAFGLE